MVMSLCQTSTPTEKTFETLSFFSISSSTCPSIFMLTSFLPFIRLTDIRRLGIRRLFVTPPTFHTFALMFTLSFVVILPTGWPGVWASAYSLWTRIWTRRFGTPILWPILFYTKEESWLSTSILMMLSFLSKFKIWISLCFTPWRMSSMYVLSATPRRFLNTLIRSIWKFTPNKTKPLASPFFS